MLLTLAAFWSGSFLFNAVAVAELPVLSVVTLRVALGALLLQLVLRAAGQRLPGGARLWGAFGVMGLLNNCLPFGLIVWGQQHLASGVAAILNAATPLFTVLLAHALTTDEKLTRARLSGVMLGFMGVAVLIGGDALQALGNGLTAQLACLGAAISYALAGIFGRRFRVLGVSPMAGAAGQLTASSLLLVPVTLLADRPWLLPMPSAAALWALLGLALLSTALAYVLYFRLLATVGATNLLLVTLLVPPGAILLGSLFLHEPLQPRQLGGTALIALGLGVIDGRLLRMVMRLLGKRQPT
ncbi:DMT family transporter [Geminicoccus harenae]|uniref:DMT family transporter n=1 Tax=Geminicoccus harenae TaxID=2498453 RepID=UPI002105CBDC|nr:DMT family transporter [Geminicoccus harenae]